MHVGAQLCDTWAKCTAAGGLHVLVGVAIERASGPALQLTTPDTAEVEVGLAILVDEAGRVDAVTALDGLGISLEGALGLVTLSDTNAEDTVMVACGEVQVVFAVLGGGVGCPQLLRCPGDVLHLQSDAMVSHLAVNAGQTENVVVNHIVLVAIIVILDIGLTVMGGVDVELAIEDVGGGVRGVEMGDERLGGHLSKRFLLS